MTSQLPSEHSDSDCDPLSFLRRSTSYRHSLLDLDDQFARCVRGDQRPTARADLVVTTRRIPRGPWTPQPPDGSRLLGFIILDGILVRDCEVHHQSSTEVLGPQDFIQPWADVQMPDWLHVRAQWQALTPVAVAVLDRRFMTAAARWPEVLEELLARSVQRSRLQLALRCVSRIRSLDDRILVVLRMLADRWGYVAGDGIHLRLKLTHELLSRLVGAHRPSVSTALSRLDRDGLLMRRGREFVMPLESPLAEDRSGALLMAR